MKKTDSPIYLEVYFDEEEDIQANFQELLRSEQFKDLVKNDIYEKVTDAIKSNREEFVLFRMVYYGLDLLIEQKYYKKLLNTVLTVYEQEEDYLKCIEIKNLIDTL
jgi:dephospho-CoA kinase